MSHFEYVMMLLLVVVRLFLVGIVVWYGVIEVRKSGRVRRKKNEDSR